MEIPVAETTLEAAAQVGSTFFVAPNGDDGSIDGSIEHPFATIKRAIQAAQANGMDGGDQIFLRDGTYHPTETLKLREHGGPQCWSRLAAWRNEHVVVD